MGGMDKNPAPKYALEDQIQAMGGPRPFDHNDWKGKKRPSRRQISLFSLKYRYSEKQKKKPCTYSDVLFSRESIGEKNKKRSRDHFLQLLNAFYLFRLND